MREDQEPLRCWIDHCGEVQSDLCSHMAISFDIPHFPSSTLERLRLGVLTFFVYSVILCSGADSLHSSHVILNE